VKIFKRKTKEEYTVVDSSGVSFTIHKDREYTTSEEKDGKVTVFSTYWVEVPISIFTTCQERATIKLTK